MIVLRGRGHPAVRATHGKTLEFTPDYDLGPGGTCVVAVRSCVDGLPMAGAVTGELVVGVHAVEFTALANPDWEPRDRAVLRRSEVRKPDTIATHASLAASDLPRALVEALHDPEQEVSLTLRPQHPQPPRLVIVGEGQPSAAELAVADLRADAATTGVAGRTLVVGVPAPELLAAAPQPVEVLALPIQRAVAVASPYGADAILGTVHDLARREQAVVLRTHAAEVAKVIRVARRHGRRTGAIAGHLPWVHWGELATLPAPAGAKVLWLCLDPAPPFDLDERIAQARAEGRSTKAIARLVAEESGLPAKAIYARITGAAGSAVRCEP